MSEEELEDKLEKGDFTVFTQRASIWILIMLMMTDAHCLFGKFTLTTI